MGLQRTNSTRIDVAHVALAKMKNISPRIVVVFHLNAGPICHVSAQESLIYKNIYFARPESSSDIFFVSSSQMTRIIIGIMFMSKRLFVSLL